MDPEGPPFVEHKRGDGEYDGQESTDSSLGEPPPLVEAAVSSNRPHPPVPDTLVR